MSLLAWYSTRVHLPKYHLQMVCTGLENVDEDWRGERRFSSLTALALESDGRPCRRCTLEPVIVGAFLAPAFNLGHRRRLVTFSAQGNPNERGWSAEGYRFEEVTDSAATRLRSIANSLRLPVVETSVGPVSWMYASERMRRLLGRNLRSYDVADGLPGCVDSMTVVAFWSMMTNHPPEQGGALDAARMWNLACAAMR